MREIEERREIRKKGVGEGCKMRDQSEGGTMERREKS